MGSRPDERVPRLEEFWKRVGLDPYRSFTGAGSPRATDILSYWSTMLGGIPAFFKPNLELLIFGPARCDISTAGQARLQWSTCWHRALLPPAFPAVRVDRELYWDGGIPSNTPSEIIFEDHPRKDSLIFSVHMWNPIGPEPESILNVLHRQKDIQYSSRISGHIAREKQTHRLRHVISELAARLPQEVRRSAAVEELASYGCQTRMHVVRLLAPLRP